MNAFFLTLIISLLFFFVFLYLFIRSVMGGQMDDLQTPPLRLQSEDLDEHSK